MNAWRALLGIACLAVSATASAQPAANGEPKDAKDAPRVELGGYLTPGFGFRHRPAALPRDRWEYGFLGDAALVVEAEPFPMWTANLDVVFSVATITAVTDVEEFDLDGDGQSDGLATEQTSFDVGGIEVERATVRFQPHEVIGIEAGVMRIPFTVAQESPNTALMFPNRSPPNEVFVSGADVGGRVVADVAKGRVTGSAGAYNGDSLGLRLPETVARGIVLAFRTDVSPLGAFPAGEGDPKRGPFRIGAGFGLVYRPTTLYDQATGYSVASADDLRIAVSLRVAVKGVYVGVEYLRRQQTDSISGRPQIADGAYAHASVFVPIVEPVAVAPIARAGFVVQDQGFDPRTTGWIDAGLSLFPRADAEDPDSLKITVSYLLERRFTEGEDAHGALAQIQLGF